LDSLRMPLRNYFGQNGHRPPDAENATGSLISHSNAVISHSRRGFRCSIRQVAESPSIEDLLNDGILRRFDIHEQAANLRAVRPAPFECPHSQHALALTSSIGLPWRWHSMETAGFCWWLMRRRESARFLHLPIVWSPLSLRFRQIPSYSAMREAAQLIASSKRSIRYLPNRAHWGSMKRISRLQLWGLLRTSRAVCYRNIPAT